MIITFIHNTPIAQSFSWSFQSTYSADCESDEYQPIEAYAFLRDSQFSAGRFFALISR